MPEGGQTPACRVDGAAEGMHPPLGEAEDGLGLAAGALAGRWPAIPVAGQCSPGMLSAGGCVPPRLQLQHGQLC